MKRTGKPLVVHFSDSSYRWVWEVGSDEYSYELRKSEEVKKLIEGLSGDEVVQDSLKLLGIARRKTAYHGLKRLIGNGYLRSHNGELSQTAVDTAYLSITHMGNGYWIGYPTDEVESGIEILKKHGEEKYSDKIEKLENLKAGYMAEKLQDR